MESSDEPARMNRAIVSAVCLGFSLFSGVADELALLTLQQARDTALHNHPSIKVAELKAMVAREATREAQSGFYPNISGNVVAVGTAGNNTRLAAVGGLNNPIIFDR